MAKSTTENLQLKLISLARGQVVSLLTAGTGVFASLLSQSKPVSLNFPLLLSCLNYILCSFYLIRPFIRGELTTNVAEIVLRSASFNATDDISSSSPGSSARKKTASLSLPTFVPRPNTGDGDVEDNMGSSGLNPTHEIISTPDVNSQVQSEYPGRYWWYLLAAVCDCQANYLIIRAFNYTTFTSVALLDAFTIPSAIFLSYCFMRCKYSAGHYVGIAICVVGLGCVILSDHFSGNGDDGSEIKSTSSKLAGDAMALGGAFLYACSNVLQESLLKGYSASSPSSTDENNATAAATGVGTWCACDNSLAMRMREEYIGFIGLFGSMIAFTQCYILEWNDIADARADFNNTTYLYICGFAACLFFFYTNTSTFLQSEGDAVLFNLSLLTSDVYAMIFTYFNSGHLVHWLYFLGFTFVFTGVYLYHARDPPSILGAQDEHNVDGEHGNIYSSEIASIEKAFSYNPLGGNESESEAEED